jgi:hypothetical protein
VKLNQLDVSQGLQALVVNKFSDVIFLRNDQSCHLTVTSSL